MLIILAILAPRFARWGTPGPPRAVARNRRLATIVTVAQGRDVGYEDRRRAAQGGSNATPKKATGAQQKGRTGAGARTTKSTARGAKSAGAQAQRRRASAEAKVGEPGVEAAADRIRELNERIIDAGKSAGRGTLGIYESTLKAIADSLERGPGSSDIEWVSRIATAQANFIRDLTKAWASAARDVLK